MARKLFEGRLPDIALGDLIFSFTSMLCTPIVGKQSHIESPLGATVEKPHLQILSVGFCVST